MKCCSHHSNDPNHAHLLVLLFSAPPSSHPLPSITSSSLLSSSFLTPTTSPLSIHLPPLPAALPTPLPPRQNEDQRSLTFPVDSQFFRKLLEEEGPDMKDLLDAEEYLIPQTNMYPRTQGDGVSTAGHSRHHSYRVSGSMTSPLVLPGH